MESHRSRQGRGLRRCPACEELEPIVVGEVVWPTGWHCPTCTRPVVEVDGVVSFSPELARTGAGFDPTAYDRLVAQEPDHYWFEPRNRLLTGLADRFFPDAKRYLEVGCGTGFVLDAIARSRPWISVTGSELHPEGLVHARRRLGDRASFVQMDARCIPARDAFDLIGAYDVIEHISEDEAVMASVHNSLAPGGGLIVAVPQHPALWSVADEIGKHVRRYRRGELEAKLSKAKFEILHSTSYTSILLPLMFASRMKERNGTPATVVAREFDISPRLNRVLRAINGLEVTLSLRGLIWAAGGSRVVVARKPA